MNENMLPIGTLLRGDTYRIEKQIGSGGFGNTYVVRNMTFDELFAMKEFFMKEINLRDGSVVTVSIPGQKATFEAQRNKFKKEAKRLRKLDNKHIVKVHDLFEENGTVYYVMDLIDGRSLHDIVKSDGPINETIAMDIFHQMLEALSVVHSQDPQMLHLDIKPSNIMLDKSGKASLLDFGSSKQIDKDNSYHTSTAFTYTPGYAPSELIDGNKNRIGPWTDLYGLGATLYNVLTGHQPPTISEITEDGNDAFIFSDTVSEDTRKLIYWLMSLSRNKRPKSVEEIQKTIENNGGEYIKSEVYVNTINPTISVDGEEDDTTILSRSSILNSAINEELSFSKKHIEQYGISIFSFIPDYKLSIYYRGKIFKGDEIGFQKIHSYEDIESALKNVTPFLKPINSTLVDAESYIRNNKSVISDARNIITYCCESDLLKIFYLQKKYPAYFNKCRILHEMQLLPLCHDSIQDSLISFEYQHLFCETEFGKGVVEILQSGFIDEKDEYLEETTVKKLSNLEGFSYLLLGTIIQYHIIEKDWGADTVLLSAMPFAIKVEIWTNGQYRDDFVLLKKNNNIPLKKSKTITDDNCSIVIVFLGERFFIEVNEVFQYKPKTFELTIDIDANTSIKYILLDKEMKKQISITQIELLNYEVNTNNDNTNCQFVY